MISSLPLRKPAELGNRCSTKSIFLVKRSAGLRVKAAIKRHALLELRGSIPAFIHITSGQVHHVNMLDLLLIEPGALFPARAKTGLDARRLDSARVGCSTGLICDQTIAFNGFYSICGSHRFIAPPKLRSSSGLEGVKRLPAGCHC